MKLFLSKIYSSFFSVCYRICSSVFKYIYIYLIFTLFTEGTATFIAKVGGDPIPNVKWMKGKWRQMTHGGRITIEQKDQIARMEIKEATKSDAGQYRCVASNKHGEIECNTDLNVDEKKETSLETVKLKNPKEDKDIDIVELLRNVDPKEYEKYARMYGITDYRGLLQAIEQLKREKEEESGRPVRVSTFTVLKFLYKDTPNWKWFKGNDEIPNDPTDKTEVKKDGKELTLTIKNAQPNDVGEYVNVCVYIFFFLFFLPDNLHLNPLEIEMDFTVPLKDVTVPEKKQAKFECSITKDVPKVMWYRGSDIVISDQKYDIIDDGKKHMLVINHCEFDDEGEYTIEVLGKTSTAKLTVEGKSRFGSTARFELELSHENVPVAWYKNETKLHPIYILCNIFHYCSYFIQNPFAFSHI
uniref:Ig-like domain-containing protein n=1 Tax=Astyanax mexicanus TaxID=7994 RepID=W5L6S2_ASTMX